MKRTQQSEKPLNGDGPKPEGRLVRLMKSMGSDTGRFDPLPPDQHRWQMREGEAPKNRVWAWMVAHTSAQRFRLAGGEVQLGSAYAVDEFGHELHLADIQRDLLMDGGHVMDGGHLRSVWREHRGILWRNGTKDEGEQRLYLLYQVGELPEAQNQEGEEKAQEVCTHLLPSFILKKTKGWPQERVTALTNEWELLAKLDSLLRAVLVANGRSFIGQAQDNLLARFDVKYERQIHHKTGEGESGEKERRALGTSLLPAIENFVQTLLPKVSTDSKTALYSLFGGSVQTSIYKELEKSLELRENKRTNGHVAVVTEAPSVRPEGPQNQNPEEDRTSLRVQITEYLRTFKIPSPLDLKDVDAIAALICSEKLLRHFKEATAPERCQPKKWILLIRIAEGVARDGPRYDQEEQRKPVGRLERLARELEQERANAN